MTMSCSPARCKANLGVVTGVIGFAVVMSSLLAVAYQPLLAVRERRGHRPDPAALVWLFAAENSVAVSLTPGKRPANQPGSG